jgi:hypothetical protein
VALATTGAWPAASTGGGGDVGSRCGAGTSAAHCSGIFDLTSDRAMRDRLAAR